MQRIKIFALPYAAGSAGIYFNMKKYLCNIVDLVPIELPGHGSKYVQPLCHTIQEMAQAVFEEIKDKLDEPYCLLGYSMGSLVEYELYNIIRREGLRLPEQLFLFAADAPYVPRREKGYATMSDKEVVQKLRDLNGSLDSALNNDELMGIMVPIARADFLALEEYQPTILDEPITTPGFVMVGENDEYCIESMEEWQKCFLEKIVIKIGDGAHFFMFNDPMQGYKVITREIYKINQKLDMDRKLG